MSFSLKVFCRRALPALTGGWNSNDWTAPRFEAGVDVFEVPVDAEDDEGDELPDELRGESFVVAVELSCRSAAIEHAIAYGEAIARAGRGVAVDEEGEILCDHGDQQAAVSAAELERAWRDFDVAWNE